MAGISSKSASKARNHGSAVRLSPVSSKLENYFATGVTLTRKPLKASTWTGVFGGIRVALRRMAAVFNA
jgi:hypothetical protein